jgi:hypothetical protein
MREEEREDIRGEGKGREKGRARGARVAVSRSRSFVLSLLRGQRL